MDKLTQRQETFCLKYFEVGNATEAALIAGYAPKYCATNTDKLLKNTKIKARLEELRQKAEDATVATVLERKQILTEIARGRFADFMKNLTPEKLNSAALQEIKVVSHGGDDPTKTTTIKLHNPINAIAELNKMERIYEAEGSVIIDNRTLIINVTSEKGKKLTERLIQGERTTGDNGHQDI